MDVTRRLFLMGGNPLPIRPPWALPEDAFLQRCDRCAACMQHCPQGILVADRLGYPMVDFTRGGCTFCSSCVQHCSAMALIRKDDAPAWRLTPSFATSCLNARAIPCRICGEQCEQGAIVFRPVPGGAMLPELLAARCNGCGACVAPCPAQAISLTP